MIYFVCIFYWIRRFQNVKYSAMVRVTTSMGIGHFFDFPPLRAVYERGKRFFPTLVRSAMRVHFQSLIAWRGNFATWATAGMRERTTNVVYLVRSHQCAELARHLNCRYYPIVRSSSSENYWESRTNNVIAHRDDPPCGKKGEINKFQSHLLLFPLFVCVCVWLNNFVKQTKCQPLYEFNRVDFKSKGNSKSWATMNEMARA